MKNLYEILQVNKNDSKEEIEKSYKKLVKKYHPDIAKNKVKAEEIMKEINNAYDILSDEEKRRKYDEELSAKTSENTNNTNTTKGPINNQYKYSRTTQYTNYNNINNNYNMYTSYKENSGDNYNKEMLDYIINCIVGSKKIFVVVLLIFLVFTAKLIFNIYHFFNENNKDNIKYNNNSQLTTNVSTSNNNEEIYIVNEELPQIFINFMNDIKYFNLASLNKYLSSENQIKDNEFQYILINRKIINNIVNNMEINISNPRSSNLNNGLIDIEVKRINLDYVLLEVSKQIFLNYNQNYTRDNLYNIILQELNSNKDRITTIKTTIKFTKENEIWKINFANYDFYNVFGFNIKQEL